MNDHLFGEKLLIQFALGGYREILSVCLLASFPFGFDMTKIRAENRKTSIHPSIQLPHSVYAFD